MNKNISLLIFSLNLILAFPLCAQEFATQTATTNEESKYDLEKNKLELKGFLQTFIALCKQSKDFSSNSEQISMFDQLISRGKEASTQLDAASNTAQLLDVHVLLINMLSKHFEHETQSEDLAEDASVEQAFAQLHEAFAHFSLHNAEKLTHSITHVGVAQRVFLKTLNQMWWHLSHAHLKARIDSWKKAEDYEKPTTYFQRFKNHVPMMMLSSGKVAIGLGIDEISPNAGASTKQKWIELLCSYLGGYLLARAIVGNSDGFKNATQESLTLELFNILTRTKFYLNKESHLYSLANRWSYIWTFRLILGNMFEGKYTTELDYEAMFSMLKTIGGDVAQCTKKLLGEAFPGLLDNSVPWPPFLQKKPRRRSLTYLASILLNGAMKSA